MRFTRILYRSNLYYLRKRTWKKQAKLEIPPLSIPPAWKKKNIEDPNEWFEKKDPEWIPSVKDDPRFSTPSLHPDYHENEFMFEFSNDTKILEGEDQALILTKSHRYEGMPDTVARAKGLLVIQDQDKLMQRYIMQSHWWDPTKEKLAKRKSDLVLWQFKAEYGTPPEKRVSIFLRNLVRLLNLSGGEHRQFVDERRTSYHHHVSAQYPFQDKTIWTRFISEIILSGEDPIPKFSSVEEVKKTTDTKLPDLYPVSPFVDLKHQHVWRIENNTGWSPKFNYQAPHLIFINNRNKGLYEHADSWEVGQNNARALMTCMAHATAFAKFQYGTDVKDLPQPVCVQAIHTDSVNINFVFFQLNTLDLTSIETGIKNQVWFDSENALLERHEPKRSMLRNTRLLNYDPEVLRKIFAVYAYGMIEGNEKSRLASKN